MSISNVLRLEDYRDRRVQRLRVAESLYSAAPGRQALLRHITEAASITGADRAAIVWVDEYGPGLVHPHVVLDLLADRPRRSFSAEGLRRAWELGVPSALDEPGSGTSDWQSALSVALGSDGTRAWFLVTESVTARSMLDADVREKIMFLAGECSALVLHRDLDAMVRSSLGDSEPGPAKFAGWPVLQDMEGREPDVVEEARISRRFVVARLARMLVDDDLTLPTDRIAEQVRRARDEIQGADRDVDRETHLWFQMLDAFESLRLDDLATTLVNLGQEAEAGGHHNGALELYGCAYEISAAVAYPTVAIEAARLIGRIHRRRAEWDEARTWYSAARVISAEVGEDAAQARALAGLSLIHKERGNLPAARTGLLEALPVAAGCGDADTLGSIYQDLMSVEQVAEDLPLALEYGWLSVTTYVEPDAKVRGLAALAGVLIDVGENQAAEDAWAVVAYQAKEDYYKVYAWDALAYLAALRQDGAAHDRRIQRCDALGWADGHPSAAAEILYYRGLGCQALGRFDDAERLLRRAVTHCEEHGFNRTLFLAEAALGSLRDEVATPVHTVQTPSEVRLGLREMRVELVGSGV
jgi:tetratricopeptide (TPR) repeat protein